MSANTVALQTNPFLLVATKHRDGSVLLSTSNDRLFKLNGLGALTWLVFEQSQRPLAIDDVVRELYAQFELLNGEREGRYEVSPEQLKDDTERFVKNLADAGLLQVFSNENGCESYLIKEDVSGTTSTTMADIKAASSHAENSPSTSAARLVSDSADIRPSKIEVVAAFMGLLAFDFLLRLRGFQSLIEKVERWPLVAPHSTDSTICKRVCAMVNRAQVFYPKKAMCLQHSAVLTCLLRSRGVSAQMVLAAQEFPAKAHAWTEVDGRVVNDSQQVKAKYRELRRV